MDNIIIGGAMANTFLVALGHDLKNSLIEKNSLENAKEILDIYAQSNCNFILPVDFIVSHSLQKRIKIQNVSINLVPDNMMALDLGKRSIGKIKSIIDLSKTILWNGPLGAFEIFPFDNGTNEIANYVSTKTLEKKLTSVAGGGDTISALNNSGVTNNLTFFSTAGGAFLELLEGKELPGIKSIKLKKVKG